MSRDRTAVLWDLSLSRTETSGGIDSAGTTGPLRHRNAPWGSGAGGTYIGEEGGAEYLSSSGGGGRGGGGYGEMSPVRVSTTFGLPDAAPGMSPATVFMLPLSRPPSSTHRSTPAVNKGTSAAAAAGVTMFGEGFSACGSGSVGGTAGRGEQGEKLPVLFAASGDRMVASVVRRELGREREEEVHPARFVGPSGKTVSGKKGGGGRRSSSAGGGLVVRSVAVLPLRRLSLLGCADGWVRIGT